MKLCIFVVVLLVFVVIVVFVVLVMYQLDLSYIYLSFEVDYMGGLLKWCGKFEKFSGIVMLDCVVKIGSIDVIVQIDSIDFGFVKMNEYVKSVEIFDVVKYLIVMFKGNFMKFKGDVLIEVEGQLMLYGVIKLVKLEIDVFKCMQYLMFKCEVCGVDVEMKFKCDDFGVDYGKVYGFNMEIKFKIQVEGIK